MPIGGKLKERLGMFTRNGWRVSSCTFDSAAEFTDGSWWYKQGFDLCAVSSVTLNPHTTWAAN